MHPRDHGITAMPAQPELAHHMHPLTRIKRNLAIGLLTCALALGAASNALAVGSGSGGSSKPADNSAATSNIAAERYATAIRILKSVVRVDKRNADALNLLGFASRKLARYQDAQTYYARALKIDPKHLGALEYQGELFLILNQPDDAANNLALLLTICGADCDEYRDLKHDLSEFKGSS